ncbi:helix-turn-helix protein [Pseudonocardia endophytica]|uniref:Helix-turn-helix protein n=1 Tax=Pseudonocardia endophytica TaxID=401976 RepID=A0A4R1I2J5_PSEEN|nr:helix-turn-helix protein [Pseudonocardia endophytica]
MERSTADIEPLGPDGSRTPGVLTSYELCRGARFDAFRDSLNGVFYPARVEPTGPDSAVPESWLSATSLTHLTLGFVRFGTETALDPGALGAYHVNVAMSGSVESRCGSQHVVARPGTAAVFTPHEHTLLPRWGADAGQLCIKINRRSLESELENLVGRPISSWVRFSLGFDLTSPAGKSWLAVVRLLLSELDTPHSLVRRSVAHREQIERMVVSSLLLAQPSDYFDALHTDGPPARSRTVKRVVDAIDAAPEKPWDLSDMARVAGVSGRRLQQGFREQMEMSPTTYLRTVRLERVRADLVAGTGSVTDVALRWGFTHLSRFSAAYRDRFGEAPSDTLRTLRS